MWYTIHHTCGHEERQQIYGHDRDRQRKIEWLEGRPCDDCRRKQQLNQAKEVTADLGLPELKGTEKQLAWAEQLRAEVWTEIEQARATKKDLPKEIDDWIQWLFAHDQAHWWIDQRLVQPAPQNVYEKFFLILGARLQTSAWQSYWQAWQRRVEEEAIADRQRQKVEWHRKVCSTLGVQDVLKVWTAERNPDDRRIYLDDALVWRDGKPVNGTWTEEQVAMMRHLRLQRGQVHDQEQVN